MTTPEVAVLVGLQASGKTTFYRRRLAATHAHVSKDNWPNARHRQRRQLRVIAEALGEGRNVAVDNTNPSPEEWGPLIVAAKEHGARVVAYWFPPDLTASLDRNTRRPGRARVPEIGIHATVKRLRRPRLSDGFDAVHTVTFDDQGGFTVRDQDTADNGCEQPPGFRGHPSGGRAGIVGEARRVRDRYNAAFNAHDIDALLGTVSPDGAFLAPEGMAEGREELRSYLEEFWAAFPDVHTVLLESFDVDDMTVDELVLIGTHKGRYRGPGGRVIPPTGRPLNLRCCYVCTVENGLIISLRLYFDQLELLSQLGVPLP